ncbi:hypothetical protein SLE2022_183090 [Rubroshorea leprosula]
MPASPSDARGRWKRRKRDRKPKQQLHDDNDALQEDDEEEDNINNDDLDNSVDEAGAAVPDPSAGPSESEVLADGGVRISEFPVVVKRTVNRPHPSVMAIVAAERAGLDGGDSKGQQVGVAVLENISYGQLQALSAEPAAHDQDKFVIAPPPIMECRGVVKRFGSRVHVVPMHSDWFSPATVHRLERQVVPHFFSGKSPDHSPEKYMECRNYIVAKYMDNPDMRLITPDCQGLVDGISNEDLARIVRFLDHWGIINYCAASPSNEPWNGGSFIREDTKGEVHVPSAALKSIDSLIKFDKPKCRLKAADVYSSLSCHGDDFSYLDDRIRERLSENCCNHCSQPLTSMSYQSQKEVDVLSCSDCFHDGRFVSGHSSIDFIRVDSAQDYGELDGETWSDQETLLLLEAMEIFNENWNEIAEYVGTKSKSQCILHFLRLPMENGILENIEVPNMSKSFNLPNGDDNGRLHSSTNGSLLDADSENSLPFANSGNPVMSLVAFLASAVGPRVAAACAHTSLAALSENVEGAGHGDRTNSENVHGKGGFHGSIQQKGENSAVHGSWSRKEAETAPLSVEKVKTAAKAGLAAAAMKAKLFADHEEREIQRHSANIINNKLRRLELKLKQFAEIETLLMKECEQVEKTRQRFAAERAHIISTGLRSPGVASQMSLPGVAPSMVNSNISNMRPQVISASPSQPSISGYGSSQQVHPHMPFMPRQAMFPMGPRVPLAAMQASTTAPNVMLNAPANAQPGVNHPLMRSVSGTSSSLG